MNVNSKAMRTVFETVNAAVVSSLCCLMVVAPVMSAEEPMKATVPTGTRSVPLTQQEKTLHALNRLTFGPRPGDEAMVQKMGLEAWFQQQLHPDTIDDAALETRLEAFPAMKLPLSELTLRFPSPQTVKAMAQRGAAMPSDPTLHAVYADVLAAYEEQQKGKAAGAADAQAKANPAMAAGMADGDIAGDGMMQPGAAGAQAVPAGKKKGGKGKVAEKMSADEVQALLDMPADARMNRLLDMSPEEMLSFRAGLKQSDRPRLMVGLAPAQMEIVAEMEQGPVRVVGAEAMESRLVRDVYSERQLQAVMTDFWLNHFNVYARKNQNEPYLLPAFERDSIRPYALGKFENLLIATAQSPAMLVYLDNWESVGPDTPYVKQVEARKQRNPNAPAAQRASKGINENYARELMELHTMGVNGGYTQKDVQEVAKVFTGWTLDKPYQPGGGGSIFDASRHEGGDKMVLGHVIHEGGQKEGLEVLHILATSPATAKFVSTKLAVRFVSDNPPDALVNRMADTFLKSDGDMRAVLTTMFHSPEFWAPEMYRAKVKTPIEFMVSALRASGAEVRNPLPLVQAMGQLGMPIYGMQTPNGYSWKSSEWVSTNALISRMNFALVLSGGRLPGTFMSWPRAVGSAGDASVIMAPTDATEAKLESVLLGEPASAHTRATVLEQSKDPMAVATAEQNFNKQPVPDMIGDGTADMGGAYDGVSKGGGGKGRGQRGEQARLNQPETPLGTMAGLLIGSPDFQRR